MRSFILYICLLALLNGTTNCNQANDNHNDKEAAETDNITRSKEADVPPTKFEAISPSFLHEDTIPMRYTCDGENISPALSWSGFPPATQSIAMICEDPDATKGTFIHWVIYNIPPDMSLTEDFPKNKRMDNGILQGENSASKAGYTGPCPPSGNHRYFFRLYALDKMLELDPNRATEATLKDAMQGHVLGAAVIMGRYSKKK